MNTQQALEQSDHVERAQKGSSVATKYINYFERGKVFPFYDQHNPAGKFMAKIIHASEGQPGEFNFYLKRII
ncbi:hypothetical protein OAA60_05520 [Porticoccaceae bacterium]|nr:hypothetical protein [Porticoccaceae bacterium]